MLSWEKLFFRTLVYYFRFLQSKQKNKHLIGIFFRFPFSITVMMKSVL